MANHVGAWTQVVCDYLASDRGRCASASTRARLRMIDGVALGFRPGVHGLDEVHQLRLQLETWAPIVARPLKCLAWIDSFVVTQAS